ncbi:uncharacterized protein LOC111568832 isoform X2 [Amphiprion ocellaris]|uniref:uncharacterized protein LOC111568832 isoform X2 n=1 Tax=Amphiprion ocellaris TaxID=80972 RepID=UPI002410F0A7|nr:uncharacterized protein LOC111568832 isoform X2 [Amphiprion ocellaris]
MCVMNAQRDNYTNLYGILWNVHLTCVENNLKPVKYVVVKTVEYVVKNGKALRNCWVTSGSVIHLLDLIVVDWSCLRGPEGGPCRIGVRFGLELPKEHYTVCERALFRPLLQAVTQTGSSVTSLLQTTTAGMGRGVELSDFQRGTVVGCYLCKKSNREIAALLNLPASTISSVILKWKRGGITTALPRSGRPHKLKEQDRQVLEKVAMEKSLPSIEALTAEFQTASGANVSATTIRRELHEMGFRGRVSSYSKPKGEPDRELNPKKRVWEEVQPDLRTDSQCVATYKGAAFEVVGKGVCKSQTMSDCEIK